MGHIRLGELPRTGYWPEVIAKLEQVADPGPLAKVTAKAAHKGLQLASTDTAFSNIVFLFMKAMLSSRNKQKFRTDLKQIGLSLSTNASPVDFVCELDIAMDKSLRRAQHRSHIAEMARYSIIDTLNALVQSETRNLFDENIESTRQVFKHYASKERFALLGRNFWGSFLYRFFDYHLSREIPNHIGRDKTFSRIEESTQFKESLRKHCMETALIVQDFTGGWPAVTEFRGGLTSENVRKRFMPIALKKISEELARR